ncbi:hypothetical protein GGS24DRAFT_476531 [Hypoxylon argillaceum]|nr:hypothetical protein GGS24DRAFT_476531 [Hypoxylon argillaceum]KAI1147563.1 hypothetical protein F4825DRAFT_436911 [Nemania diffusa]
MYYTKATISAALVAAVNAHMIMKTPAPFDPTALNNSPLDASGSDFPCKFSGTYTATGGTTNTFALGSDQELSFIGSAVHGGGSCQVVLTYDNPPTKDSKWKVIHSIEGGCPAKGQAGNLPENPDGTGAGTYKYTIPSDIPSGKGVIGWTWFNRIGNREMYMNCGPLELTGTGGDQANFDKLPDMVVLNIGSHPQTIEGVDYKFEDAGSSVENNIGQFGVATCGNDGCKAGDTAGSGSGSGSSSSAAAGSSATTSAAAASSSAAAGNGGGVFLTTGTPASSAVPTSTAAGFSTVTSAAASSVVATATPSATPTAAPTSGSGSGSTSGSAGALSGACTSEGMWNCISGTSYQQCASGLWSAVQQMASGTKCTPGQNMDLGMVAAGRKVRAFRA